MTVKELVKILKNLPDQSASVFLVINTDAPEEVNDTSYSIDSIRIDPDAKMVTIMSID